MADPRSAPPVPGTAATAPADAIPEDVAALSFEQAMEELERIVRTLEAGQGNLEDSIAQYERGALLKRHCDGKLREAQMTVDAIARGADGAVTAEPAAIE